MVSQTVESVWLLGRVAGIHIAHVWEEKMRLLWEEKMRLRLCAGGTARRALLHMFPSLFCQEGQGDGIVVGEVLDSGVVEQKSAKPGGVLPGCMLPAASRSGLPEACRHATP